MNSKDLAQLFRWHTPVEIKDRDGSVTTTMYIRLVGDVDYNQAQQYGLVASRKLRKLLKDSNSIENQSLFLDLDERAKEDLVLGTILAEVSNFRDAALADLGDSILNLPASPVGEMTLEEREKQVTAEEEAAKERIAKIQAKMEEKSNQRKTELEKLDMEEVRKIFVASSIDYRCIEEFSTAFREYCVFAGSYLDQNFKTRAFDIFDDFRNASPNLKRQLTDAYLKLEITGEQLKN